jgi:hypothetical protein
MQIAVAGVGFVLDNHAIVVFIELTDKSIDHDAVFRREEELSRRKRF